MRRFFKGIALACLLILVAVLSFVGSMPASSLLSVLPTSTPLAWAEVKGTLWQGQASNIAISGQDLGPLQWQWQAAGLLQGQLAFDIKIGNGRLGGSQGRIAKSWNRWQLSDVSAYLPAQRLDPTLAQLLPMSVTGQLEMQLESLSWSQSCDEANADLLWKSPELNSPLGVLNLENMSAQLSCDKQSLKLDIKHDDSQINLEAQITVSTQQWSSLGKLKAGPQLASQYQELLPYLGPTDARGYYRIKDSGPLLW